MDKVTPNLHHLLVHWSIALITVFICSTLYAQTPIVDQSNLPVWTGGWTNVQAENNATQTFTPQFSTLTGVDIDLVTGNPQYGTDLVTVEILRGTSSLVSISQLLAPGFEGLLHLDFPAPIPTNPGETLKLVVKDTTLTIGWKYGLDTYPGGMFIHHGVSRPDFDFFFQTYGYPEPCDFSIEPGEEKCFGGIGIQCEGIPPTLLFYRDDINCFVDGWMSIGSILHDKCCVETGNTGYRCANSTTRECNKEWALAKADILCLRYWPQPFGPYRFGKGGDDTSKDLRAPKGAPVDPKYEEYCLSGKCEVNAKGKTIIHGVPPCRYCFCQ